MRSIRYGLLAVAGCGVLLLGVAVAVIFGVQGTKDLAVQQERVGIQLFGVREVFETLLVMESSQRGYLLTRDPAYLEPYRQEAAAIGDSLNKLDALFRGDAAPERIIAEIRELARVKRVELAEAVALAERGDFDGAMAIVASGAGKHEMALLRYKLFSLIAERRAVRTRLVDQSRSMFHQVYFLGGGAALLVLVLVAVAVRGLSTSIARLDAAQRTQECNALHHALTGLPHRRYLSEWLTTALAGARRSARQLCVLYFDLDGFKAVNDRFGHEAGDRVLEAAAARLQTTLRASDFVARLGGDEFVAVLPDTKEPPGVEALIERLEEAFRPA